MAKQNPLKFLNKGISTPIGILIIVICALLAGGILAWQWAGLQKIKAPETKAPEELLPPSPPGEELAEEETTDWQTYTNTKYGLEVKYPVGWQVENEKIENSSTGSYLQISQLPNPDQLSLQEWFDEKYIVAGRPILLYGSDDITINNYQAKILESELEPPNPAWHVHIIDSNNRIFSLFAAANTADDKLILDQILSTFRFLE